MEIRIKELAKTFVDIPKNSSIAIFPHVGVDGDCLGSTLALRNALEILGHRTYVITEKAVPTKFNFIPQIDKICVFNEGNSPFEFMKSLINDISFDYGILVDCSQPSRTGGCALLYEHTKSKMIIDHHYTSYCEEEYCIIDPTACAAGELVYKLIDNIEKVSGQTIINFDIATNIMTAIISDTGGYRYSNTNKDAFGISRNLVSKFPVNIREIAYQIFERTTISRVRLIGKAFSSVSFYQDNKIVICTITKEMMESCDATESDVDGICSELKTIEGVAVAFVIRHSANAEIRVNIRSNEMFDASGFASIFGGGGHMRAAGFTLSNIEIFKAHDMIAQKASDTLNIQ